MIGNDFNVILCIICVELINLYIRRVCFWLVGCLCVARFYFRCRIFVGFPDDWSILHQFRIHARLSGEILDFSFYPLHFG